MTAEAEENLDQSKAPLVAHLTELRNRLVRVLIGITLLFFGCFAYAGKIYAILVLPYQWAAGSDAKIQLIFTAPHEFLFTQIKLALFGALFLGFPLIAIEFYKFLAPGLYKKERAVLAPYLMATPVFFMMGAAFVFFFAMPTAMRFFLAMQQNALANDGIDITLLPKVDEYLKFIMSLMFAFGLMFQLPVVLTLLAKIGIVSSQMLKEKRRYAIVLVFIAAAILTPPDIFSQFALAVPTLLLYELSVLSVRLIEKRRERAHDPDAVFD